MQIPRSIQCQKKRKKSRDFIWLYLYPRNKILTLKKQQLSVEMLWMGMRQEKSDRLPDLSRVPLNVRAQEARLAHCRSVSAEIVISSTTLPLQSRGSGFLLGSPSPGHLALWSLRIRGNFHLPFSFLPYSFFQTLQSLKQPFSDSNSTKIQKESRLEWINKHGQIQKRYEVADDRAVLSGLDSASKYLHLIALNWILQSNLMHLNMILATVMKNVLWN